MGIGLEQLGLNKKILCLTWLDEPFPSSPLFGVEQN